VANRAFKLLERVIVPEFYERSSAGVPRAWVAGVKRSLASLAWRVSMGGPVREYERLYHEAAHTPDLHPSLARR
jgi:starch phosphorylase